MSALAAYPRPYSKLPRAREIAIQCAPVHVGRRFKPLTIARIPRTSDVYADHAMADLVVTAFELVAAGEQLLRDGHTDDHGVFTYSAPPRAGQDAIQRLRSALQGVTPPRRPAAASAG